MPGNSKPPMILSSFHFLYFASPGECIWSDMCDLYAKLHDWSSANRKLTARILLIPPQTTAGHATVRPSRTGHSGHVVFHPPSLPNYDKQFSRSLLWERTSPQRVSVPLTGARQLGPGPMRYPGEYGAFLDAFKACKLHLTLQVPLTSFVRAKFTDRSFPPRASLACSRSAHPQALSGTSGLAEPFPCNGPVSSLSHGSSLPAFTPSLILSRGQVGEPRCIVTGPCAFGSCLWRVLTRSISALMATHLSRVISLGDFYEPRTARQARNILLRRRIRTAQTTRVRKSAPVVSIITSRKQPTRPGKKR